MEFGFFIGSAMCCCCSILILYRSRVIFSRAKSEVHLVTTGLVRVSTLRDDVVSCLITLVDSTALRSFTLETAAYRGELLLGVMVELKKMMANFF